MKLKLFIFVATISIFNSSWNMETDKNSGKTKSKKKDKFEIYETPKESLIEKLRFDEKPTLKQIKLAKKVLNQEGITDAQDLIEALKKLIPEVDSLNYQSPLYFKDEPHNEPHTKIRLIMVASYSANKNKKFILDYSELIDHLTDSLRNNIGIRGLLVLIHTVIRKMPTLSDWTVSKNLDKKTLVELEEKFTELIIQINKVSINIDKAYFNEVMSNIDKILIQKIGDDIEILKAIKNKLISEGITQFNNLSKLLKNNMAQPNNNDSFETYNSLRNTTYQAYKESDFIFKISDKIDSEIKKFEIEDNESESEDSIVFESID